MLEDSIPRCLLLIVFLIVGGFFSGSETAFSFCNEVRIRLLAENGNKKAKRVVFLLDRFDKTVVTLLIAINILHVVSASIATVLMVSIMGPKGSVVATVAMTLATFIFSETIPKNFAKANSDAYSLWAAGIILLCYYPFMPAMLFLSGLGEFVKKVLHIADTEPSVTEEEFSAMVDGIESDGLIEANEKDIIQSSIKFNDIKVGTIMTPADEIVGIDENVSGEELKRLLLEHNFSRYPVYNKDRDRIIGVLLANDVLYHITKGEEIKLEDFMDEPLTLSPGVIASDALQAMRVEQSHFAVITDETDTIVGILTMDDILERLVGEIQDEEEDIMEHGCGHDGKEQVNND